MMRYFLLHFALQLTNTDGWTYFLKHLSLSCPIISPKHPKQRCQNWSYFTFISDREKGAIDAIKNVFPYNHYCLVHIKCNAFNYGNIVSKCISNICFAFDRQQEEFWINELKCHSLSAYSYIMNIEPTTWRNTSWVRNQDLPPRYGIVTSNLSESANSMFDSARDCTWLKCIDTIMHIMIK